MKDFRTLKLLDFFRILFEKSGIDYPVMRKILAIKLTMDGRRVPTIFNQQRRKKNKPEGNGFIKSLGMYAFLGVMLTPFIIMGKNFLFQMSIFFGVVMFLVMTSMISDFSNVLLDVRDRTILQTKPVDKRTISAAKTIHICIYLLLLTTALTGIPIIAGAFRHGILFLVLAAAGLLLIDLLIVVLTAVIYYLILQFFDGEKLKDIINYVQIGLSITIAVGYQVLSRSFSLVNLNVSFEPHWWHFILPPIWFGASFEVLMNGEASSYLVAFSLLALLIPILAIILYIRMMPSFERNLVKLSNNSGKSRRNKHKWKDWLLPILCRSREEKAFYRFSRDMMRNEREFRLKVYPSLGLSLVFPFIFMFNEVQLSSYTHLTETKWYLAIYMCTMMIPTTVSMLKYSGKYKGAWIYKTAPLKDLAPLYSAVLKVFIVNLFLPVYIILSIIFTVIFGFKIIPDLFTGFMASILYTVICSLFLKGSLPFSESFADAQQSAGLKILPAMLLAAAFFGVHYAFTFVPFGVPIYLLVLAGVVLFIWRMAKKTIWNL